MLFVGGGFWLVLGVRFGGALVVGFCFVGVVCIVVLELLGLLLAGFAGVLNWLRFWVLDLVWGLFVCASWFCVCVMWVLLWGCLLWWVGFGVAVYGLIID